MRFLARFHDDATLLRVRRLLREKGIPTHVMTVESARAGAQWALFACIDEQVDDALRLMRDPDHEPRDRVDAGAFEAWGDREDPALLVEGLNKAVAAALVLSAALVALAWCLW